MDILSDILRAVGVGAKGNQLAPGGRGGSPGAGAAKDSTSIHGDTQALLQAMGRIGRHEPGAEAGRGERIALLREQLRAGTLATDSTDTAAAILAEEGRL